MKTPKQLIDEVLNSGEYDDQDVEFASSLNSTINAIGITSKQYRALLSIVEEHEAAKAGWTPYGPDHAYRVGL